MDTTTALDAANTWRKLAQLIPTIELYLEPRRGKSEVHLPPSSRPPIDITASDLLHDIDEAANWYIAELLMETTDVRRAPNTRTARLELVADRHGHWTADPNPRIGLEYADTANDLMRRVEKLVTQPAPPKFMGPCLAACGGDLWLRHGRPAAICDQCGSAADLEAVREQLMRAMESRLMDRSELVVALRFLGAKTPRNTVDAWITRGRLVPVLRDPQMFRLGDALDLANVRLAA